MSSSELQGSASVNAFRYGREEEEELGFSLLSGRERRQAALSVDTEDVEGVRKKPRKDLFVQEGQPSYGSTNYTMYA